ncbi:hypothetical protein BATDEDRAFT_27444 [Batrachochytrium dendrobatidis JAM81]|uniref:DNA endonuclease activator Ctp1 C-terminal domain-containing protein n=1 Tax=Batrachochytrium dendrobatidis (strain JAM81 / FGSC 10211) TaxID=684364 RepID=F4PAV7_BATDJ|nr:uncharacterized protein BATDEDRAFT_27444 [Batrachochytrium dendrobatidis JAM81]EGF77610.1 hypothetical protein BATDEDRAFT_27444 [Batrachochytrium dendrobatidis JAM81]|eukprot:XP_006681680.1 hypothetical protein BATDEDRAFT_27444 [Batrachochytrium dendrobatidis JAM81]
MTTLFEQLLAGLADCHHQELQKIQTKLMDRLAVVEAENDLLRNKLNDALAMIESERNSHQQAILASGHSPRQCPNQIDHQSPANNAQHGIVHNENPLSVSANESCTSKDDLIAHLTAENTRIFRQMLQNRKSFNEQLALVSQERVGTFKQPIINDEKDAIAVYSEHDNPQYTDDTVAEPIKIAISQNAININDAGSQFIDHLVSFDLTPKKRLHSDTELAIVDSSDLTPNSPKSCSIQQPNEFDHTSPPSSIIVDECYSSNILQNFEASNMLEFFETPSKKDARFSCIAQQQLFSSPGSPIVLFHKFNESNHSFQNENMTESRQHHKQQHSVLEDSHGSIKNESDENKDQMIAKPKADSKSKMCTPVTVLGSRSINICHENNSALSKPSFAYEEVVRDKERRKQMHGEACPCCEGYYRLTADLHAPAELGAKNTPQQPVCDRIQNSSRHRFWSARPKTPPGFWRVDFPSTQENRKDNVGFDYQGQESRLPNKDKVSRRKTIDGSKTVL